MILDHQLRYVTKRETVAKDPYNGEKSSCLVPTENTVLEKVGRKVRGVWCATHSQLKKLTIRT